MPLYCGKCPRFLYPLDAELKGTERSKAVVACLHFTALVYLFCSSITPPSDFFKCHEERNIRRYLLISCTFLVVPCSSYTSSLDAGKVQKSYPRNHPVAADYQDARSHRLQKCSPTVMFQRRKKRHSLGWSPNALRVLHETTSRGSHQSLFLMNYMLSNFVNGNRGIVLMDCEACRAGFCADGPDLTRYRWRTLPT